MDIESRSSTTGAIAAALVAGGIGCAALGLLVVLAEASSTVGSALVFYPAAGSLSGKAAVTVIVWFAAWAGLHRRWSKRDVDLARASRITLVLVALGVLGTFPPIFYLFG